MKKSTITIMIVFILIVLSSSIFLMVKYLKNDGTNLKIPIRELEDIKTPGYDDAIMDTYINNDSENDIVIGDSEGRIISKDSMNTIILTTRQFISNFKFQEAEKYIRERLKDYNLDISKSFDDIREFYFELPILCQLPFLIEQENYDDVRQLIKGLSDSENFFISTMYLDRIEREYIINSVDSLNPVFFSGINVVHKNILDASSEIYKKASLIYGNNEIKVEEIRFIIDENPLNAYIVDVDGQLYFYGIKTLEGHENDYYTIEEWDKISEN